MRYYAKVLDARNSLAQADPHDQRVRIGLAETLNYIGVNLARKKDYVGALESYRKSVVIREELARNDPSDETHRFGLAWAGANIGQVYATMALRSDASRANQLKYCRQSRDAIREALPNWIKGQSVIWLGMGGEKELTELKQSIEDCNRLIARLERT